MVFTGYRVVGDVYSDLCSVLKKYGLRAMEKQAKVNFILLPNGFYQLNKARLLRHLMTYLPTRDPDIFKYESVRHEISDCFPMVCPENGSFIAYKRVLNNFVSLMDDKKFIYTQSGHVLSTDDYQVKAIATLEIPDRAKRSSAFGNKCRASEAIVKDISVYVVPRWNPLIKAEKLEIGLDAAYSTYVHSFYYRVGETVKPDEPFNENRWIECASGIHFFMTLEEALNY